MSSQHLYHKLLFQVQRKEPKIIITEPVFTWENAICTFVKHLAYTDDHGPLNNIVFKWITELGIHRTKEDKFHVCQPVIMYFFMGYSDLGWLSEFSNLWIYRFLVYFCY
jgi:hypothetical protein